MRRTQWVVRRCPETVVGTVAHRGRCLVEDQYVQNRTALPAENLPIQEKPYPLDTFQDFVLSTEECLADYEKNQFAQRCLIHSA